MSCVRWRVGDREDAVPLKHPDDRRIRGDSAQAAVGSDRRDANRLPVCNVGNHY